MKTRVALLREIGRPRPYARSRPIEIVEAELDPPGPGEMLVKMAGAGLCHSDLSVMNGDRPRGVPLALGHEASGVVQEVGQGVRRFSPGDHVVMVFVPSCGHCTPCAEGRPALCEPGAKANGGGTLLSEARRIRVGGTPVNHHMGVSAFSDYAVVDQNSCVKIDPAIPLDLAALFGCAVLTGVGAVVNTGELRPGQSCAVVGLGGVGLAALLGAVAAGARDVVAVDLDDAKLDLARQLGATHAVNAGAPDAVAQIREITGGGAHLAVELAGVVPALKLAYDCTRRGGTTVTAGLPHPDAQLAFPAVSLAAEERTLKGSYVGSCVPVRDVPAYLALMQGGRLPVDRLMTHRLTLDELNEGFDRLAEGRAVRQVVAFG